ncbi:MAG: N-acetylmuramoyl-L-alanine amidase [Clostridia bacterium]|nr:N-acetylmuramoyl-L-alanine amidase [Clostridia bacterium]
MNEKPTAKENILTLILRYKHLNRILAVMGAAAVLILAAVIIAVIANGLPRDALPTNAVYDDGGKLTGILGEPTVCIDPGHGYDDPGADSDLLGDDTAEREINLDVALRVRDILTSYNIKVVMTHDTNVPNDSLPQNGDGKYVIDPVWRADFANELSPDMFVSLHCDSFPSDSSVSGTRIYYMSSAAGGKEAARISSLCAGEIGRAFTCEVKQRNMTASEAYYVIKHITAPSVLIEMGFITNETDAGNMLSESWRQKMAEAIAAGIVNSLLKY